MNKALSFVAYNNAFPIALSVLLLGAGGAFAATPGARDAIYSSQSTVVSVDNSYIANKDLANYTPKTEITGVTEDADYYYVAYKLYTISLKDAAWQDITRDDVVKVSKSDIAGTDLGVYVTGQLKQIVDRELSFLQEVQAKEQKNVTAATVSTTYGGLVGKFLDTNTETLPGYTPVVVPQIEAAPAVPTPAAVDAAVQNPAPTNVTTPVVDSSSPAPTPSSTATTSVTTSPATTTVAASSTAN